MIQLDKGAAQSICFNRQLITSSRWKFRSGTLRRSGHLLICDKTWVCCGLMDQSCVCMATDGGLAGITLIIEPPSPPLLLCHLSSASNVILTPGLAMTSLHQAAALREASHSSLQRAA